MAARDRLQVDGRYRRRAPPPRTAHLDYLSDREALAFAAAAALLCAFLLHHSAGGDFLGALAVTTGALSGFFDVFVLALAFATGAAEMFLLWHMFIPPAERFPRFDEFQGGRNPPECLRKGPRIMHNRAYAFPKERHEC